MIVSSGSSDLSVYVKAVDSTDGVTPETGLAHGDVTCYYVRTRSTPVEVTLSALAAADSLHSAGGWFELSAVLAPLAGVYRLDLPDAALAEESGVSGCDVYLSATGVIFAPLSIDFAERLVDDLLDADLGNALPTQGSVREALMFARAYAGGTREIYQPANSAQRYEQLYLPDRGNILQTRQLAPDGGPYTQMKEIGDFTLRLPAALEVEITCHNQMIGGLVAPPAKEVEVTLPHVNTPLQVPAKEVEIDMKTPNPYWS